MSGVITLSSCPKVYQLETHRCRIPESTCLEVEGFIQNLDMISLSDATEDDRIGLPVYLCRRRRPDGSVACHTGKGLSRTQAKVSLLMEAVERYCSEFRPEHEARLVCASLGELSRSHRVLDPRDLLLPQFSHDSREQVLRWVEGYDLLQEEPVFVPACSVFHPYPQEYHPLTNTHTNGIASGNTLEEAIFHGICEVVERDAWSIAKFNQAFSQAIVLQNREDEEFLLEIVRKYEAAGVSIIARNVTSDTGIPTIAAFAEDLLHPHREIVEGFGTHLDPKVAMARALLEIATTRALFLTREGGFPSLPVVSSYLEGLEEDSRLFAEEFQRLAELDTLATTDVRDDLQIVLERLRAMNFERVIVVDLTHPKFKIPTVRVVIPGMEVHCFDRSRRGPRLHQAMSL